MDLSPDEEHFQGRLLHQAALWDNLELLTSLLSSGAAADARDAHARTPLHAAALAERSACLAELCRSGAALDAVSDDDTGGKTALHISAERGHVENISTLLAAGASLTVRDAAGRSALQLAEGNNHRHAANRLREAHDALERERLSAHSVLRELVTRGDVTQLKSKLQALGADAELIVNMTPGGANTLLYVASGSGLAPAVSLLVAAGADGRAHPATRYGPLYIAAYHGHLEVVKVLLHHFPEAVQQETVEKWLPLHAACLQGHAPVLALLLEHDYPEHVLNTYTDRTGCWTYRFPFDVNAVDARGVSALAAAAAAGARGVLALLVGFSVPASGSEQCGDSPPALDPPAPSPARAGISLGIHALVSKLTGAARRPPSPPRICPVRLDAVHNGDSVVGAAARAGDVPLLRTLLDAGASADAPSRGGEGGRRARSADPRPRHDYHDGPMTALAAACAGGHVRAAELLLQRGATDGSGAALTHCARRQLTELMAKILATKAHPDPDHKLNRSAVSESVFRARGQGGAGAGADLTYSALAPSTPVSVAWRDLKCHLDHIRMSWLRAASLHVNGRISSAGALLAITRVDVSNNDLRLLPPEIFTLTSLKYLNAAGNKLERLPSSSDDEESENGGAGWRGRGKKKSSGYTAGALSEVYLQDNRLESLPPALFLLPSLTSLDVSNNKLRALPRALWAAPALKDLNAALNHLTELCAPEIQEAGPAPPPAPPDAPPDELPPGVLIADRAHHAACAPAALCHPWRAPPAPPPAPAGGAGAGGPLSSLSLAHNQFTTIPPVLACAAPNLTRLNMSYNSLRSMSYVTSYPTSLRQLDLSHNEITCWPSLPQLEMSGDDGGVRCYCGGARRGGGGASRRERLLRAVCRHRSHLKLAALRTLILSNNLLTRIQLTTDDDGTAPEPDDEPCDDDDEWSGSRGVRSRLVFPLLSMLDVSCNLLRAVPPHIHHLTNLSVLNISGNKDVSELPPQMGLLTRLWSLSAAGCSLAGPLRHMLGPGYKSADVVGYLRSVLHAATKYTRMRLMIVGQQGIGKTSLLECLRQESAIQHRRKPTEHWAKRMGNKSSRRNVSTVGVDIGAWTYEKQRAARGPLTFRTWDFGGQQEYYSTHQYFLSRRCLYLVVWKLSDGRKGLAPAISWLRSIQARAPGSPVIMVATHYDQVANSSLPECESPESLQRLIRCSIMGAPDADKLGLPRVMDSIEVSCSTRHNVRLLADIIYSVAFSVKPPGSKEPLLEQRIPASYLALEECVAESPHTLLAHAQYKEMVNQYMVSKGLKPFRDAAELHQATMFLHENGVLLHYDDATLKELYFLRPQWLCDVLAHVVTVREINPFANNGIMKVEDLAHVFKASPSLWAGEEGPALGLSLLQKFELALCWDKRTLLVPSLLPKAPPAVPQLPVRVRPWSTRGPWPTPPMPTIHSERPTDSPTLIQESRGVSITGRAARDELRRVLALTYAPGGLVPRLCARLLADSALSQAPKALYTSNELSADESIRSALEAGWGWKLWARGCALVCGDVLVASVREVPPSRDPLLAGDGDEPPADPGPYDNIRFRVTQEDSWSELELCSYTCLELRLPALVAVIRRDDGAPIAGYQSISVEPSGAVLARLLAVISDHVDLLLEDWYPALGTRFVHTSEGKCLITRVVPCAACLRDAQLTQHELAQQAMRRLDLGHEPVRERASADSRASDGDSGVGGESNASSSVGGAGAGGAECGEAGWALAHAWTVEHCILWAASRAAVACRAHGDQPLRQLAPDLLLLDVEEERRARWEHVTPLAVVGRGAFGTVLRALWRRPGARGERGERGARAERGEEVAVKVLQPVPPPPGSDAAVVQGYKACVSRWEREPLAAACRAYVCLRAELGVLRALRHAHVLPLLGACPAPRALLLGLARAALDAVLKERLAAGCRVGPRVARALLLQVARALEYLHGRRVVYRDLKSENVLVWRIPSIQEAAVAERTAVPLDVHVKLGDYGISRMAPPSGTKGFGGTEGFMAPEIMRYNGEEEYNEKVDCFSFGMLMFEVATCRAPYDGLDAVKEAVLDGHRPTLTHKELEYPVSLLECMRRCWAGSAAARPAAGALVAVLAAPEAVALRAAAAAAGARAGAAAAVATRDSESGWEIWYGGGEPERAHTLVAINGLFTQQYTIRIPPDKDEPVVVTAMCFVDKTVWIGDSVGRITCYCASTCAPLWTEGVGAVWGAGGAGGAGAGAVAALAPLTSLAPKRVAVAMSSGRLFLVSAQRGADDSFILTELGTASELCALAALPVRDSVSVWAGGADLSAYSVVSEGVASADAVPLPAAADGARVTLLSAADDQPFVYGYIYPGSCIYQWCGARRAVTARLECGKLEPCSEALDAAQHQRRDDDARVVSLCAAGGGVAAGTRRGCVLLADQALRPLAVCRPYQSDVTLLVPLGGALMASFGRGYRPLLQRYAPQNNKTEYNGNYCLLWKTLHWLPD